MRVGVYAPCIFEEQIRLWDDLGGFLELSQQPWCVCGDFNMVLKLEERRGCSTIPKGNRCSRIDRVLVTSAWCERFDQLRVRSLPRGLSDHTPLLLQHNVINGGPRPFRFINVWMAKAKNVKLMGAEWVRLKENDAENSLIHRLKSFKGFLRDWNLSSFGDVDCNITKVTKQIEDLDKDCRAAGESEEVAEKRKMLQGELWKLSRLSESIWRQKSRVTWLKEGDMNTEFFHRTAKIRSMRNVITGVLMKGGRFAGYGGSVSVYNKYAIGGFGGAIFGGRD
ncbi:hypothetical protein GQ457_09G030020 [Hibiscus cannabinus]